MSKKSNSRKKYWSSNVADLGSVCAAFGFVIVFVAVMTPMLHILTQNKRLEAQSQR